MHDMIIFMHDMMIPNTSSSYVFQKLEWINKMKLTNVD